MRRYNMGTNIDHNLLRAVCFARRPDRASPILIVARRGVDRHGRSSFRSCGHARITAPLPSGSMWISSSLASRPSNMPSSSTGIARVKVDPSRSRSLRAKRPTAVIRMSFIIGPVSDTTNCSAVRAIRYGRERFNAVAASRLPCGQSREPRFVGHHPGPMPSAETRPSASSVPITRTRFWMKSTGHTAQLQRIAPAKVTAKIEAGTVADQRASFVDAGSDVIHRSAIPADRGELQGITVAKQFNGSRPMADVGLSALTVLQRECTTRFHIGHFADGPPSRKRLHRVVRELACPSDVATFRKPDDDL